MFTHGCFVLRLSLRLPLKGCLEGLGWRKSFKMNRKLGWGTLNCMITVWSVDTIVYQPYHLISCVLVANTQFSGYVFSPKIRVFVKRKKKFHFISWRRHTFLIFLFCSVLKAASGSPTHQISDLPETIQRERYTSVCFFLSIFGHFSKSHHILWQKNEMKDVFPEQYVRVKQYELCALYTRNVQNTAAPTFNTVLSTGL